MDIARLSAACLRRWYLLLPLLLLTGLGVVVVGDRINPEYQSNGSVLFYGSAVESPEANPYGNAVPAASALTVIATGGTFRSQVAEEGFSPDYEIEEANAKPGTSSPMLAVLVRADDPESALGTRDAVIAQMSEELNERQAQLGIPLAARTSISVLDVPEDVSTLTTGPLRAQIVVLVLGVALSFLLVVLLDDLILSARRRRQALRSTAERELAPSSRGETPQRRVVASPDGTGRAAGAEPGVEQFAGASGRDGSAAT